MTYDHTYYWGKERDKETMEREEPEMDCNDCEYNPCEDDNQQRGDYCPKYNPMTGKHYPHKCRVNNNGN